MNRKVTGVVSTIIIILCIAYIIYDIATGRSDIKDAVVTSTADEPLVTSWQIVKEINIDYGTLFSVALTDDKIICSGDSFLTTYDKDLSPIWNKSMMTGIKALAVFGDTIYAATREVIILFTSSGNRIDTWGPYDEGAIITSIAVNNDYVAFADAGNTLVFVLNKSGALKSIVGHPGNQFIIPSPYFDVALTRDDTLVIANTGKRKLEFRTIEGNLIRSIGEEGDSFDYFCGCCNPAHFAFSPDGNIVTAEKGINRIKIIKSTGELVEPVAQPDHFIASIPVDLAISKDGLIYAANRYNSVLYVFKRCD
ncbi:MAG: hypothetical protein GH151_09490 [Bacteroidetes bacterium]|nr:hypothetical protein [Bacteroidota bacterium]